ncbi:MAG: site-specific DNA-methyltransferase [Selenomonadaceae bacterium]|nr:site-specific DNA-methyltransferase [Selenomonadaceae bacterium]
MDQKLITICGDAVEEIKKIPEKTITLIATDPPYNLNKDYGDYQDNLSFNEYLDFSRKWLTQAKRVLKDDGSIYLFMGVKYISYIYVILEQELKLHFNSWITWFYTQGIGKTKGFSPRHDDILFFTKHPKNYIFNLDEVRVPQKFYRSINNMRGANPGNVWQFSHVHYCNGNRYSHPTQKPEGIFERIILASSNEGDVILDPFVGSGTALRVCQQLNRNCIGVDINPYYIEIAKKRLSEPFYGFDSLDERMKRLPADLNDLNLREEYIKNHVNWFLKNNPKTADNLIKEFEKKHSLKQGNLFA